VVDEHHAQRAKQLKTMKNEIDICLTILSGQGGGWGGGGSGASESFPRYPLGMSDLENALTNAHTHTHAHAHTRTHTELATEAAVRLFALLSNGA
jgi:hypothetical protein